jgi:hypothetical protein
MEQTGHSIETKVKEHHFQPYHPEKHAVLVEHNISFGYQTAK